MIKIHIITPVVHEFDTLKDLRHLEESGLELSHSNLEAGTISIESGYDEVFAGPDTVLKAIEAEKAEADAIVINCMGDPALEAVQEAVRIPVLGCGQTSMYFAALLGHKFSILPTLERRKAAYHNIAIRYGIEPRLASVRPTNIPVREIDDDPDASLKKLIECATVAVSEDDADVIIFGCTHFATFSNSLAIALLKKGYDVPIINPLPLTISAASNLVKNGLTHSKKAYPFPPKKELFGYKNL